jgi:hypothetical protein
MNLLHFVGCFILGLIFYHILKGFSGCKDVIEGQGNGVGCCVTVDTGSSFNIQSMLKHQGACEPYDDACMDYLKGMEKADQAIPNDVTSPLATPPCGTPMWGSKSCVTQCNTCVEDETCNNLAHSGSKDKTNQMYCDFGNCVFQLKGDQYCPGPGPYGAPDQSPVAALAAAPAAAAAAAALCSTGKDLTPPLACPSTAATDTGKSCAASTCVFSDFADKDSPCCKVKPKSKPKQKQKQKPVPQPLPWYDWFAGPAADDEEQFKSADDG